MKLSGLNPFSWVSGGVGSETVEGNVSDTQGSNTYETVNVKRIGLTATVVAATVFMTLSGLLGASRVDAKGHDHQCRFAATQNVQTAKAQTFGDLMRDLDEHDTRIVNDRDRLEILGKYLGEHPGATFTAKQVARICGAFDHSWGTVDSEWQEGMPGGSLCAVEMLKDRITDTPEIALKIIGRTLTGTGSSKALRDILFTSAQQN